MNKFTGKRVLITGGTSGIGLALADAFHAAGARVAVCARSDDARRQELGMMFGGDRGIAPLLKQATEVETLMLLEQGPAMGQGQGIAPLMALRCDRSTGAGLVGGFVWR